MTDADREIVLSTRLSPATPWEASITERTGVPVVVRSLEDRQALVRNASDALVVIVGSTEPFDDEAMAQLPRLGLIARRGVGLDNIDTSAAARRGIVVTNIPDASVEEVSDQAIALAVALCRRVASADRHTVAGDRAAARAAVDASRPMTDLTLGLLGLGRIGRRVAQKGRGIFAEVLAHDPAVPGGPSGAVTVVDRDQLLARSDVLSVHVPLTRRTRSLVGREELALLPAGAIVVNTARAGVIDERELGAALDSGALGGVGLDVTNEMAAWCERRDRGENVLLTGHTGARGTASQDNLRRACAAQVVAFLSGQTPAHVVGGAVSATPGTPEDGTT